MHASAQGTRKVKNCWEYWSCVKAIREKCPVYRHKYGRRCWLVALFADMPYRRFESCGDCPWYLENAALPP